MLTTHCPSCSTAFRVKPEQLKARAGKVRCGHCSAVFNALETLEDAPPAAAEDAAALPAEPAAPNPVEAASAEPPPASSLTGQSTIAPPDEPVWSESVDLPPEDGSDEAAPAAPRWPLLAWSLAGLAAMVFLLVQSAYFLRAELAVSEPALRPLLEEMCALLECDIPLPRKADLVSIEASDLHPDPQQKNLLVLAATLKNRAPFAQDYPHLELTLTDTRDQPILRKVLAPAEYLAQGADVRSGFAGNGDLAVSLWLDPGQLGASGYRLYVFYP